MPCRIARVVFQLVVRNSKLGSDISMLAAKRPIESAVRQNLPYLGCGSIAPV